jgi:hypothetical protein
LEGKANNAMMVETINKEKCKQNKQMITKIKLSNPKLWSLVRNKKTQRK